MPAIGRGVLPDPSTIDPAEYGGWLVLSSDPEVKDKFYELSGQRWILNTHNIIEASDPVVLGNDSVIRVEDLSTQIVLQTLPSLP